MDESTVELTAKLKIDTSDAEKQLNSLNTKKPKQQKQQALPDEATKSLKDLFSGDKGLSNVGQLAKSATGGINGLLGSLEGIVGTATAAAGAIAGVTAVIAVIVKLLQGTDTMQAITTKLDQVFNALREVLAPVLSLLGDIVMTLLQLVEDLLPILQPLIDSIAIALKPVLTILQLLEPVIRLLGEAFEFLYDVVKVLIKFLTLGLVNLDDIAGSTSGKKFDYSSSLDAWETSGDTVFDNANSAADKLKDSAGSIEDAADILKSSSSDLSDAASGLLQGLANAASPSEILKKAEETLSKVNESSALVLDTVKTKIGDALKGVFSGLFSTPASLLKKLKLFDNGGTLGAQVWGMNERGNPEFIFNAGGTDTVINADILENAMYNAVRRANAETTPKELTLKAGGSQADARQLVRWLLPALKLEWRA